MNVAFKIAFRYFFSKSRQTVINRINALALILVTVATAALFVVLSAFEGLKDFGLSFTKAFDADYLVQPATGKYLSANPETFNEIENHPAIQSIAPEIETKVFLSFKEKNQVAYLKGVNQNYTQTIAADTLVLMGDWLDFEQPFVVAGFGIANNLSLGVYDYNTPLKIAVPKRRNTAVLSQKRFNTYSVYVSGLFQISEDLDQKYIFGNIIMAQNLLGLPDNQFTGIQLQVGPDMDKTALHKILSPYFVEDFNLIARNEKNAAYYKMLNTENLATYFIFTLVMVIALFNVVGALIMMILDKKGQIKILLAMGCTPADIQRIFFLLGLFVCAVGGLFGILIGSGVVLVQYYAPFIYVPGTYLPYPVSFLAKNVFIVGSTLGLLGLICALWATRGVKRTATLHHTVSS